MLKKPVDYDKTQKAIQGIVDIPDRKIDRFIGFCLQNNRRLSANKRVSRFEFLSNEEIVRMEQAIQSTYANLTAGAE
jgi:hypothetical protein